MPPEKGTYRSIYSSIWDDPEFQSFDPITQAVFFCLRTSRECNFSCIYPHYHSSLYERMPRATDGAIDGAIANLIRAGWVQYERPVLWIVKGLKNDPSYVPGNEKQILGIINHLKTLPKLPIVDNFARYYGIPFKIKPSDAPQDGPLHGPHQGVPHTPPMGPGKQGKGKGKGNRKRKKDLPPPVDNSTPTPRETGPTGTGGSLNAPPAPGPLPAITTEEARKYQELLEKKRKELGFGNY